MLGDTECVLEGICARPGRSPSGGTPCYTAFPGSLPVLTSPNSQHDLDVPFVLLESDVPQHLHFFRSLNDLLAVCRRALTIFFKSWFCEAGVLLTWANALALANALSVDACFLWADRRLIGGYERDNF